MNPLGVLPSHFKPHRLFASFMKPAGGLGGCTLWEYEHRKAHYCAFRQKIDFVISGRCTKMLHVHGKVYIRSNGSSSKIHEANKSQALPSQLHEVQMCHLVHAIGDSSTTMYLGSLSEIQFFNSKAAEYVAKYHDFESKIVFTTESTIDARELFMIGCHLIINHGLGFEETYLSLKPFNKYFSECSPICGDSFETWLRCFCCAKCLDWIDFRVSPQYTAGNHTIQIDKFIHDDRYPLSMLGTMQSVFTDFTILWGKE